MMPALPPDFPELPTLTADQLGAFLGVSGERCRQLAKEGVIIKMARGQFDLRQSVLNYVNYTRNAKTNQHGGRNGGSDEAPADYENERARLTRAKAARAEIELDVILGRVHEGEAVLAVWTDNLMACRSKLLTIPTRAAPIVAGMDAADALENITNFIHEALEELADYNANTITERTDRKRLFGEVTSGHDESLASPAETELIGMG